MPTSSIPRKEDYRKELKPFTDGGWEVDFDFAPRENIVKFMGRHLEDGFQFTIDMERDIWMNPVLIPMFLSDNWRRLQRDMVRRGFVMPALVVWTGNRQWLRPESWAQLAQLINRATVRPEEVADARFRMEHKISLQYGPIVPGGDEVYELDVMVLPDFLGGDTRVYLRKEGDAWQLITAANLVVGVEAANGAKDIVNYHNLKAGEFEKAFPAAQI